MKLSVHEAYRTMLTDYPDVLNTKQAAEILQVDPNRICKMIEQGYFPSAKPGKGYVIPKFGLIQYLLDERTFLKKEEDQA